MLNTSLRRARVVRGALSVAACAALLHGASASAAAGSDRLYAGERLNGGQSIVASSGDRLIMQTDGNLVLYAPGGMALWSSRTNGHSGAYAVMQGDGNFVVYGSSGALWNSNTNGTGATYVVVQTDANVVAYGSGGAKWNTGTRSKGYAAHQMATSAYGWGNATQWNCLNPLWERESGWNPLADNPSSSAYGIPQALPGDKMATEGADWRTNPATQIRWGLKYVQGRYGNPCGAWSHSNQYGWY